MSANGLRLRMRELSGAAWVLAGSVTMFGAQGCLDRPVTSIQATSGGVVVDPLHVTRPDKVDLLLVVDNSASMKDKQSELGRRIPELIKALTEPGLDPVTGKARKGVASIHVGVITSSLGSAGTAACSGKPHNDDRAHLLPRDGEGGGQGWKIEAGAPVKTACPTPKAGAPLTWATDATKDPSATLLGAEGGVALETAASCVVESAEQDGCGYEATLEAMYRFLIDPAPPASTDALCNDSGCSGAILWKGLDEQVLAQRKAFLRPDSLLAVVVLSDENDASLKPVGTNWLPWARAKGTMPHGWGGCAKVPDDFEPDSANDYAKLFSDYRCKSCIQDSSDPACTPASWSPPDTDMINLRAWEQTRRFGYNFLWPVRRYVDGLTSPYLDSAKKVRNPIFESGFRTADQVILAGIVGVPKTLVSNPDGTSKRLGDDDWAKLVSNDHAVRDPHMIESILARPGLAKTTGDPSVDPIHGGERAIPDDGDLQYACIAKRATDEPTDDCTPGSPLCSGGKQQYFKAYPGLRFLRAIHALGASGFAASICDESFSPAIKGISDKLQDALQTQCVYSVLDPDPVTENVNCLMLESFAADTVSGKGRCEEIGGGYCTPGAAPCRVDGTDYPPVTPEIAAAQLNLPITSRGSDGVAIAEKTQATASGGNVYVAASDGKRHLVCESMQLAGGRVAPETTKACVHDPSFDLPAGQGGWCYSKDPAIVGEACLARKAPGTVRFFGDSNPKNGSEVFRFCIK
jgi:hypothetical protein